MKTDRSFLKTKSRIFFMINMQEKNVQNWTPLFMQKQSLCFGSRQTITLNYFRYRAALCRLLFDFFISFLPEKAGLLIILTKYTVPAGVLLNLFVVHVANRRIKYCCLICLRECKQ